jgi:hypothetical protein
VKLPAVYWPSSVRLASLPPAETVSVPLALAPLVVCDQPMVGWSANEMPARSSRSVGAVKPEISAPAAKFEDYSRMSVPLPA